MADHKKLMAEARATNPELKAGLRTLKVCRQKVVEMNDPLVEDVLAGGFSLSMATMITAFRFEAVDEADLTNKTEDQLRYELTNLIVNVLTRNIVWAMSSANFSPSDIEMNVPRIIDGLYVEVDRLKGKRNAN